MKLTHSQKQFLADVVYIKCQELYFNRFADISQCKETNLAAYKLFDQCLESFNLDLIPNCASLGTAFISYFQEKLK